MTEPETKPPIPSFREIGRGSWIDSLRRQYRQHAEERKNPPVELHLSAEADPSALAKLVNTESPIASLIEQVKATIEEIRHPTEKFQPTAQPVETGEIWAQHDRRRSGAISLALHVLVVSMMIIPFLNTNPASFELTETIVPLFTPLFLDLAPMEDISGGGGGGGLEEEEPPTLGEIPQAAEEQFVPPTVEPTLARNPLIVMAPTVVAPQLIEPDRVIDLAMLGAPDGIPGPPSAGPGTGGGIGTGQGTGVGEGRGTGVGEGEGAGFGGGVFRIGGGVSPPTVISQVQPEYSEEARKARYQGVVVLEAIVHPDGSVEIVRVKRSLGFGLDEKAIEALQQWRFRPGMRGGEAVAVQLNIEVNFNLR